MIAIGSGWPTSPISRSNRRKASSTPGAKKGRRWVEVLDAADVTAEANFGTKIWNQTAPNVRVVAQAAEKLGEPSGIRTLDPLIKSQVLYRLS